MTNDQITHSWISENFGIWGRNGLIKSSPNSGKIPLFRKESDCAIFTSFYQNFFKGFGQYCKVNFP